MICCFAIQNALQMGILMGSRRRDRYIKWRGGIAYYYRRTPSDILPVDPRRFIEHSLKTSDVSIAEMRRDRVNAGPEPRPDRVSLPVSRYN